MFYTLAVVSAGLLIATDDVKKDDPLTGNWTVVTAVFAGGKNQAEGVGGTATFAESKLTVKIKDSEHTSTYKIDTTKKPATIDLVPESGPNKGVLTKGIFAIDKDELKICVAKAGQDRPSAFASKPGEETLLMTFRKAERK